MQAVDGVDFEIAPGETLGLVGESGSGKSTVARLVLAADRADRAASVRFDGHDLRRPEGAGDLPAGCAADMQMVFQDPYSSLDPRGHGRRQRRRAAATIHVGCAAAARDERVRELLELVGLGAAHVGRYPHEFSGGQRQRIAHRPRAGRRTRRCSSATSR